MVASYVQLEKAYHSVLKELEADLGIRLVVREDFSMQPSQVVSTNLQGEKKLFASKRSSGIHNSSIWKGVMMEPHGHRIIMSGTLWWATVVSAGANNLPPAPGGNVCSQKRVPRGPLAV
jgi:hypothetical protein